MASIALPKTATSRIFFRSSVTAAKVTSATIDRSSGRNDGDASMIDISMKIRLLSLLGKWYMYLSMSMDTWGYETEAGS